jgi:hypothetical protein
MKYFIQILLLSFMLIYSWVSISLSIKEMINDDVFILSSFCFFIFVYLLLNLYDRIKEKRLKNLLKKLPYRVIIDNILIFYEFREGKEEGFFGYFRRDKFRKIFLIWKTCCSKNFPKDIINLRIRNLSFNIKNLPKLPKLPYNIEKLVIFRYICFKDLPYTLKILKVEEDYYFKGDLLSKNLIKLTVIDCWGFVGNNLPENLKILNVVDSKEFIGNSLPKSLKVLRVSECYGFIGNSLPKSLKVLRVSECYGFIGNSLPKSLKWLDVDRCDNFIGKPLPKSLEKLNIWCSEKFKKESVPKNVEFTRHNYIMWIPLF